MTPCAKRHPLLGSYVDAFTADELYDVLTDAIVKNDRMFVANHNLHSLYMFHHSPAMQAAYNRAGVIHADGMWVVFLAKALGAPFSRANRICYLDAMGPLLARAAERGWRVFSLGGKPEVASEAARRLRERYPGLELATHHGYFDHAPSSEENLRVLHLISCYEPQILLVGMGMPVQERWIAENMDRVKANVILNAGGYMAYVAGAVPTPPRWAGQVGLEWLFRFSTEPKRLWKRYFLEPWFIMRLVAQTLPRRVADVGR